MNPMRILYPQPQTGSSDPVVAISMRSFVANMQDAVNKHKRDKNHVLIAPVPVGYQAVSGEGKNLLVSQEIQQAEDSILLSLGVSRELLSGVTNWTSSTIGLRLLENTMLIYIEQILGFVNWAMAHTAKYLNLESCNIRMTPFRLIDDENLRQTLMGLVSSQGASMSSLYESFSMDYDDELKRMESDAVAKAVSEIKTKLSVDRAVFLAAKEAADKFDKESDYKAALTKAQGLAEQLLQVDPNTQRASLGELRVSDYAMYLMVTSLIEEYRESAQVQQQQQEEEAVPGEEGQESSQPAQEKKDNSKNSKDTNKEKSK